MSTIPRSRRTGEGVGGSVALTNPRRPRDLGLGRVIRVLVERDLLDLDDCGSGQEKAVHVA